MFTFISGLVVGILLTLVVEFCLIVYYVKEDDNDKEDRDI